MKKYMHRMNMGIKDFFQEHIDLKEFASLLFLIHAIVYYMKVEINNNFLISCRWWFLALVNILAIANNPMAQYLSLSATMCLTDVITFSSNSQNHVKIHLIFTTHSFCFSFIFFLCLLISPASNASIST